MQSWIYSFCSLDRTIKYVKLIPVPMKQLVQKVIPLITLRDISDVAKSIQERQTLSHPFMIIELANFSTSIWSNCTFYGPLV